MRLFVRYNQEGKIIAVAKIVTMDESLEHPYGQLEEGEAVLEIEPTAKLKKLLCHEIYEQYTVDAEKKKLKEKSRVK